MIIRNVTAETYCPRQFSNADLRRLKRAFREHAPDVELDRCYSDTGAPYLIVTIPEIAWEDSAWIIIRCGGGWQMHCGGDGPLFELASEREVA